MATQNKNNNFLTSFDILDWQSLSGLINRIQKTLSNSRPDCEKLAIIAELNRQNFNPEIAAILDSSHTESLQVKLIKRLVDDANYYEWRLKNYQETRAYFESLPALSEFQNLVLFNGYLTKKGFNFADIQATGLDIRHGKDKRGGFYIFPLINSEGFLTGFQKIYDTGEKRFCFYPKKEGLATGLSVFMANPDRTVIVCLDAGNISAVMGVFSHISKKYIATDFDYIPLMIPAT